MRTLKGTYQVGTYDERLLVANDNYNIVFFYFCHMLLSPSSIISQHPPPLKVGGKARWALNGVLCGQEKYAK